MCFYTDNLILHNTKSFQYIRSTGKRLWAKEKKLAIVSSQKIRNLKLSYKILRKTANFLGVICLHNNILSPYIGDKLKQGFEDSLKIP